jgi:hypothetical protein
MNVEAKSVAKITAVLGLAAISTASGYDAFHNIPEVRQHVLDSIPACQRINLSFSQIEIRARILNEDPDISAAELASMPHFRDLHDCNNVANKAFRSLQPAPLHIRENLAGVGIGAALLANLVMWDIALARISRRFKGSHGREHSYVHNHPH